MANKYFDIDLGAILKNGVACQNLEIVWDESPCGNIYCTHLPNSRFLRVQIPEDCEDRCYYANVSCLDADCVTCEPVRIKICPCTDNNDCDACEKCENNKCVSVCTGAEFCTEDDICGECDSTHPCPCNQICLGGKCVCPPDKPYEDSKGCCSECDANHPCPPCTYCTPDGCKPLDCHCDPITGDCKECINSTDCTKPNECCVSNDCVCCDGFVRNPQTGNCDPKPECQLDKDCPPCHICVAGTCVLITVPPGYVLGNPDIGCVVKECDCDAPNCGSYGACVQYDSTKCYCNPCSGNCSDNGDCGEGCFCDNGICKPAPCFGPCLTGSDCGPGCGCLDGKCVPCSSLGCNNNQDCLRASGCDCNGGICGSSDCDTPCISALDCGDDCGCKDQNCEPCAKYTCITNVDCPEGCICNDGICGKNPCDNVYCTSPGDCGEGCGCQDGKCIPCSKLSCATSECANTPGCECLNGNCVDDGDDDCNDDLKVSKKDNCEIKGELTTEECCDCPDIGLHLTGNITGLNFTLTGELRKGLTTGSTKLGMTGIVNEMPISGSVKITVRKKYKEIDCTTSVFIAGGGETERLETGTLVYSNSDTDTTSGPLSPDTITVAGKCYRAISTCVEADHYSDFTYENECTQKFGSYKLFCSPGTVNQVYEFIKKVRCKTPLFTWSKSNDGVTYVVFRRVYSDKTSNTTFQDIVGQSEGLEICKYYKLEVDCGCDLLSFLECN